MPDTSHVFTPVPEDIVRECGLAAANVWGAVWRYCDTLITLAPSSSNMALANVAAWLWTRR